MTTLTLSQKRAQAGARGGQETVKRRGVEHMRRIGKWGAHRMHSLYRLEPTHLNDFALVHKETGEVKAFLSGRKLEAP